MKLQGIRLAAALAVAPLVLAMGAASAQVRDSRYGPAPYGDYSHRGAVDERAGSWHGSDPQPAYDWARVLRVDPVFDGRGQPVYDRRDCEVRRDGYVSHDPYREPYGDRYGDRYGDPYGSDRYARGGDYRGGQDGYGQPRRDANGRLVASVLGGIAGAVLGSRIGDGSGQVIGTAVGTVVGSAAGGRIYDNRRAREATVTVCEPEPYRDGYGGYRSGRDAGAVVAYDVTYEYAGREYVTRTDHHPGDRIRVRVDVRAE